MRKGTIASMALGLLVGLNVKVPEIGMDGPLTVLQGLGLIVVGVFLITLLEKALDL